MAYLIQSSLIKVRFSPQSFCHYYALSSKSSGSSQLLFIARLMAEKQNDTIKAYSWAFVNFKQDDWTKFLPIAKFAYNNVKNASIGPIPFKFNCGYQFCISYKKDVNLCS